MRNAPPVLTELMIVCERVDAGHTLQGPPGWEGDLGLNMLQSSRRLLGRWSALCPCWGPQNCFLPWGSNPFSAPLCTCPYSIPRIKVSGHWSIYKKGVWWPQNGIKLGETVHRKPYEMCLRPSLIALVPQMPYPSPHSAERTRQFWPLNDIF